MHGYCGKTNTQSNTAFRGFGGRRAIAIENIWTTSPAIWAAIRSMCAAQLLRQGRAQRHALRQVVKTTSSTSWSPSWSSQRYRRAPRGRAPSTRQPVLKKGLALTPVKFGISFNVAHFNQAGALVHVYTDGSVLVNHGGTEMGQGLNTKVAQVVAHELGVARACA
jgi:xanthine dehydrogenase large subunit